MRLRIKNTEITTKIISWLQIIGGLTGIGLMVWLLSKTQTINGPTLLIFLVGFSLFIFSICSGSYLFDKEKLKLGIWLSIINFLFQAFYFEFNGFGLSYGSGCALLVGVEDGLLKFNANFITSNFSMSLFSSGESYLIQINFVAILIIWILADIYNEKFVKRSSKVGTETEKTNINNQTPIA
jgi:hypothetical protein